MEIKKAKHVESLMRFLTISEKMQCNKSESNVCLPVSGIVAFKHYYYS